MLTPSLAAILYDFHKYAGHASFLLPILVIVICVLLKKRQPLLRLAPVLLDVQFTLGIMLWLLEKRTISLLHPLVMLVVLALAHIAAKKENPATVTALWLAVLGLMVLGMLIARGKIFPGLWLV